MRPRQLLAVVLVTLVLVLACDVGGFARVSSTPAVLFATASPEPATGTPYVLYMTATPAVTAVSKHFDHAEFTFDYPAAYVTFSDFWPTAFGFSYGPGHDKELDADEMAGILLPFSSQTPGINDKYLTSVQVYRRTLPSGSALKTLYETRGASGYPKSNSISDATAVVDGGMAWVRVFDAPRGATWSRVREVWLERGGKIYIISCRTVPNWYADNRDAFDRVVDSFHVK